MATVKMDRRRVIVSLNAISRTMLLGWPEPAMAHMKKKETARLSGKNPFISRLSGPGPVTYIPFCG